MKRFNSYFLFIILLVFFLILPFTSIYSQLTWQATNSELDYPIYEFVSDNDHLYAAFYGAGVYKTTDEGENWTACHTGLSNFLARDLVVSGNHLFVGTNSGGVFKSADKGDSWQAANDERLHKNIWSLLAINSRLFAGTSSGLFFTDDEGRTWQKATLPRAQADHQIIFSLAAKDNQLLAGSNSHVYLSEDRGATWTQIKVPTKLDIMTIQTHNDLWLLGTSGAGILSSEDGRNWKIWNKAAGNTRAMILTENSLILGLSEQGVVDASNAESFSTLNEGFTNSSIKSLGYHGGKLYAGTYKQGIWRYDIPKADFLPTVTNSGKERTAVNIFPNPTTDGMITLTYELASTASTQIELFDAFGKNIAQISSPSEQHKGVHQVSYEMNGLSGGTYYFHLQLGDQSITKQVVLIRQ